MDTTAIETPAVPEVEDNQTTTNQDSIHTKPAQTKDAQDSNHTKPTQTSTNQTKPTQTISPAEELRLGPLGDLLKVETTPDIQVARALDAHLIDFPQPHRDLAEKLQMSGKRSYITKVLRLLKLSPAAQQSIENVRLRYTELMNLIEQASNQDSNHTKPAQTKDALNSNHAKPAQTTTNQLKPLQTTANPLTPGYSLIRDSINEIAWLPLLFKRQSQFGDLAVRWMFWFKTGWRRVLAVGLVGILALNGAWHVKSDVRAWAARHWVAQGGTLSVPSGAMVLTARAMGPGQSW